MTRIGWFAAGAAAGVYAMVRARRAASVLSSDGLAAQAAALSAGLRAFSGQVSDAMAQREGELRRRLALPAPSRSDGVPSLIEPGDAPARGPSAVPDDPPRPPREDITHADG